MTKFACPQCSVLFTRRANRDRHVVRIHTNANLVHPCNICGNVFDSVQKLKNHRLTHKPSNGFRVLQSAFRKTCVIYRKTYEKKINTLDMAFNEDKIEMYDVLQHELNTKRSIKAAIIFHGEFLSALEANSQITQTAQIICFRCNTEQIYHNSNIPRFLRHARLQAQRRIDDFLGNGSGWILDEILATDIEIGTCAPLNGSCGNVTLKLLADLKKIKNTKKGKDCFFHAVAFHFVKSENLKKLNAFIEQNMVITIESPVKISKIGKFEKDNKELKVKINVLFAEPNKFGKNVIYPIYASASSGNDTINLMLHQTLDKQRKVIGHYSYIEDINKLLRRTYRTGENNRLSYEKSIHCPNCLIKFTTTSTIPESHAVSCMRNKPQLTILPKPGDVVEFKNYLRKFPTPFFGVFDFEACQKRGEKSCDVCKIDEECKHKTLIESIQEPITYSYIIIETASNQIIYEDTFSGKHCGKKMLQSLFAIEEELMEKMTRYKEVFKISRKDEKIFKNQHMCHICDKFVAPEEKVRDHCHVTGSFMGAAHIACNFKRQSRTDIPMFCHNLQGYDSHFIIRALNELDIEKIHGLSYNSEKFRTLTVNSFVLLDSLSFLNASLAELTNDLSKNEQHSFPILDQMGLYSPGDVKKKKLLVRKGIYPYEYVTSLNMLRKTTELPPIECFYSSLSNSTVTPEDYKHAMKVYKEFNCENMLEYTELYCKTDVALLAEIIIQFREVIQQNFGLDCW